MRNLLCSLLFLLMVCPSFGYAKSDSGGPRPTKKKEIGKIYIITLGIDSVKYEGYVLSTGNIYNDPIRFIEKIKKDYIEKKKEEIRILQNKTSDMKIFKKLEDKLKDDEYWEKDWTENLGGIYSFTKHDSKKEIISAFNDFEKKIKPEDVFVFYFAGFTDLNELLLAEGENLSANELFYVSENILSENQLFFIDGCYGENFAGALQDKVINNTKNSELSNSNKIFIGLKGLAFEGENGGQFTLSYALNNKANIFDLFGNNKSRIDFLYNLYNYADEKKYKINVAFFAEQDYFRTPHRNEDILRGSIIKENKESSSKIKIKKGETLCLIIGIDTFTLGFSGLRNTINDSREIKETIENKFKGEIIYLENINVDDFREKIIEIQRNYEFEEGSQFLFFAASHGAKDENQIGQIVFSDSFYDKGILKNTFPITALKKITLNLGCTNSLILTDICYSGKMFDEETCNSPSVIEIPENHLLFSKKGRQQLYDNYLKNDLQGHLFIGSSLDQEAADGAGKHSPFAQTIIDFLNNSKSDATDSSHLINDIKSNVMKNGAISTPMICAYNSDKEQARFFFIKKD